MHALGRKLFPDILNQAKPICEPIHPASVLGVYIALNENRGMCRAGADQVREALVATDEEAVIAKEAAENLRSVALAGVDLRLRIAEPPGVIVPLPARAVEMIVAVLTAMAERKPISLIPPTAELTAQQAADFLNMSRPHLIELLEKKQIPHRMVGAHRRIRISELQAFKEASNKTQRDGAGTGPVNKRTSDLRCQSLGRFSRPDALEEIGELDPQRLRQSFDVSTASCLMILIIRQPWSPSGA